MLNSKITYMKIAIVKLSSLGDIVHAMPVLQLIKKNIPNAQIDWFVEKKFSLLLDCNPHIDKIYDLDIKDNLSKRKYISLFRSLKNLKLIEKYDVVIDLQGLLKSAVVSRFINSKKVIGFDKKSIKEPIASFLYNKKYFIEYSTNIIKRNIKLVSFALGINLTFKELLLKDKFLFYKHSKNFPFSNKDYILVIPGASFKSKIYPAKKFIKVLRRIDFNLVVIYNSPNERLIAEEIKASVDSVQILGKLDLNSLKEVVGKAKLVIGGDTGPLHMAWGMNIPSIGIFSPTSAKRNFYETDINKFIQNKNISNFSKIDKNSNEIGQISEEVIFNKVKILLRGHK